MKKLFVIAIFASLAFQSCNDNETTPDNLFKSYDRQGMLRNIGNTIVFSFEGLNTTTQELSVICKKFSQDPSEANLTEAQSKWKQASAKWQMCQLYNFGPLETLQLYGSIDTWPVNTTAIESALNTSVAIDNIFIESKSIQIKGLKAIEYLLFNSTQGNAYILELYKSGSNASKRKEYLQALAINLNKKASTLYDAWKPSGGNYLQSFINADGNDVSSSIGLITNAMSLQIDKIKNGKIGNALGKLNGGVVDATLIESAESQVSIDNIRNNIISLQNTFQGITPDGQDLHGFDDLLNHLGAKYNEKLLSDEIKARFATALAKTAAIQGPLDYAIKNNPQQADEAYISLKDLLIVIKADMVNKLGVSLTFVDNDGD